MDFNIFNTLEAFSNPENCDVAYVYIITNFNPRKETLIKEQAVNHLNLYLFTALKGIIVDNKKESALTVCDPSQKEYSIKLNNTKIFWTNDLANFLTEDSDFGFAISFNEVWTASNNVPLYYVKASEIHTAEAYKSEVYNMKTDDDTKEEIIKDIDGKLSFSLECLSFNALINLSNTKIKFYPIKFVPEIERIDWLQYTIPSNAVYQTIHVWGDLYNKNTGEELNNQLLPLEFYSENESTRIKKRSLSRNADQLAWEDNYDSTFKVLPLLCDMDNLTSPAQLNVKNFNLKYQLPWSIFKKLTKNGSDDTTGLQGALNELTKYNLKLSNNKNFDAQAASKLKELYIKMFVGNLAYVNNFAWLQEKAKQNTMQSLVASSQQFFPPTSFEFNANLIKEFLTKNPEFNNCIVWDLFQGLCLASSDFISSPFSWNNDANFKNVVWYFLGINNFSEEFFQKITGILNWDTDKGYSWGDANSLNLTFQFMSNFFNLNSEGNLVYKNNVLLNTNLNSYLGGIQTVPLLPEIISEINDNWNPASNEVSSIKMKYLCFLFFKNNIEDFVSMWFNNQITKTIDEDVTIYQILDTKQTPTWQKQDFINEFKDTAENGNVSVTSELKPNTEPEEVKIYKDCAEWLDKSSTRNWNLISWFFPGPPQHGENPPLSDPDQSYCWKWSEPNDSFLHKILTIDPITIGSNIGQSIVNGGKYEDGVWKIKVPNRPIKSIKYIYSCTAHVQYNLIQNATNNFYIQNDTSLYLLTSKYFDSVNKDIKVRFRLAQNWRTSGWIIKNISFDKHSSFFNIAKELVINWARRYKQKSTDKTFIEPNLKTVYQLDFSFQKNNPTAAVTRNKY